MPTVPHGAAILLVVHVHVAAKEAWGRLRSRHQPCPQVDRRSRALRRAASASAMASAQRREAARMSRWQSVPSSSSSNSTRSIVYLAPPPTAIKAAPPCPSSGGALPPYAAARWPRPCGAIGTAILRRQYRVMAACLRRSKCGPAAFRHVCQLAKYHLFHHSASDLPRRPLCEVRVHAACRHHAS
jgi:hypothetical protein